MCKNGVALKMTLLILLIITGCAINHQVIPAVEHTIDDEVMPQLSIPYSVALIAKPQDGKDPIKICSAGAHKYNADLNDLTQGAIAAARDILVKNGVTVDPNGEKKIVISARNAFCDIGWWTIGYYARIRVKAGSGIRKDFNGEQSIAHIFGTTWAVERALDNAVLEMFKDPEILDYLQH